MARTLLELILYALIFEFWLMVLGLGNLPKLFMFWLSTVILHITTTPTVIGFIKLGLGLVPEEVDEDESHHTPLDDMTDVIWVSDDYD